MAARSCIRDIQNMVPHACKVFPPKYHQQTININLNTIVNNVFRYIIPLRTPQANTQ